MTALLIIAAIVAAWQLLLDYMQEAEARAIADARRMLK